jgi:hypothetical protein
MSHFNVNAFCHGPLLGSPGQQLRIGKGGNS